MMTATSTQSKYVFESQFYGMSRLVKAPGNYDSGWTASCVAKLEICLQKRFSIVDFLKYSWFINAYMYENNEIKKWYQEVH